jgi:hypothetical protein
LLETLLGLLALCMAWIAFVVSVYRSPWLKLFLMGLMRHSKRLEKFYEEFVPPKWMVRLGVFQEKVELNPKSNIED